HGTSRGRGTVPVGLGHPVAGRRRRPAQAGRRRRAPRTGSRGTAKTATENRSAIMTALELHGVSKTYGQGAAVVHALRSVDLSVEPGAMVAEVGSGRPRQTTLLTNSGCLVDATHREGAVGGGSPGRTS